MFKRGKKIHFWLVRWDTIVYRVLCKQNTDFFNLFFTKHELKQTHKSGTFFIRGSVGLSQTTVLVDQTIKNPQNWYNESSGTGGILPTVLKKLKNAIV